MLSEGAEPSDELADDIKSFVRGRLSAYAYPRRIEFVEGLPKTLTGNLFTARRHDRTIRQHQPDRA